MALNILSCIRIDLLALLPIEFFTGMAVGSMNFGASGQNLS